MRFSEFPWRLDRQRGPCRWGLTTRDGVRQQTPGVSSAGVGDKGPAEKLRAEVWDRRKAAQLNS
jgi:hypothetical protein